MIYHNNNKIAFINEKGEVVIEPKADSACDFHNGLGAVSLKDKWAYINFKGDVVSDFIYERAYNLEEGMGLISNRA